MFMFTLHGNSVHILLGEGDFYRFGYLAFCCDTLLAHGGKHIELALRYQTLLNAYTTRTSEKIGFLDRRIWGHEGSALIPRGKKNQVACGRKLIIVLSPPFWRVELCNLACPVPNIVVMV